MYLHARDCRGLVQVLGKPRLNEAGTHYKVELATRGVHSLPRTEDELRQLTKDVVSGLASLHKGCYLHRDIRSSNIVYDRLLKQYVLIDFEHGDPEPRSRKKSKRFARDDFLRGWDDETLDGGFYTMASDMRQLRKLLRQEFGGLILSESLGSGDRFCGEIG